MVNNDYYIWVWFLHKQFWSVLYYMSKNQCMFVFRIPINAQSIFIEILRCYNIQGYLNTKWTLLPKPRACRYILDIFTCVENKYIMQPALPPAEHTRADSVSFSLFLPPSISHFSLSLFVHLFVHLCLLLSSASWMRTPGRLLPSATKESQC